MIVSTLHLNLNKKTRIFKEKNQLSEMERFKRQIQEAV